MKTKTLTLTKSELFMLMALLNEAIEETRNDINEIQLREDVDNEEELDDISNLTKELQQLLKLRHRLI